MKILIIAMFLIVSNSCSRAEGDSHSNNDCEFQYIAGHDCIVCERGGISCDWK